MGGRRESEAGLRGCLESWAALTSLGAQFGWSALKKERASGDAAAHSSDRLQQQQRSPPLRRLQRGGLPRLVWPQRAARSLRSYYPAHARLAADAR